MAVKLELDKPQVFELAFDEGLQVRSKFGGDQIMFSLTNGEKWYCDPFLAGKIRSAKIGANTPFAVTKRENVIGNRRTVEYEVSRIDDMTRAAFEKFEDPDPRPTARAAESHDGKTVAVFAGAGLSPVAPAAVNPSSVAVLKLAGVGAVDAVLEIERYAQSRGMTDFAFGADNIQKLTACLFIEMSKKAGRA